LRFQHFDRRQPFRCDGHFYHQIRNDGAQLEGIFHHPFCGRRHDLSKQAALTPHRLLQLRQ